MHAVGDVMYDVTLTMRERARSRSTVIARLGLSPGQFQLATLHRAENTRYVMRWSAHSPIFSGPRRSNCLSAAASPHA